MAAPLKALILDFAGVMTSNMVDVIEDFEAKEKLKPGTFIKSWASRAGAEAFGLLELGQITQAEWNQRYGELLGIDPDNLMGRWLYTMFPAYEVLRVVDQARQAGLKTAVLSNSLGREPFDMYAGYDLAGRFDEVVLSEDVGIRKPDPAIFHLTCERLGVEPSECVFADDTEENLKAALDLGMTIVYALDESRMAAKLRAALSLRS